MQCVQRVCCHVCVFCAAEVSAGHQPQGLPNGDKVPMTPELPETQADESDDWWGSWGPSGGAQCPVSLLTMHACMTLRVCACSLDLLFWQVARRRTRPGGRRRR